LDYGYVLHIVNFAILYEIVNNDPTHETTCININDRKGLTLPASKVGICEHDGYASPVNHCTLKYAKTWSCAFVE
jgi:hypothetical protein